MNGFSELVSMYNVLLERILSMFDPSAHWLIMLLVFGATITLLVGLFKFVKDKWLLVVLFIILLPGLAPMFVALFQTFMEWLAK